MWETKAAAVTKHQSKKWTLNVMFCRSLSFATELSVAADNFEKIIIPLKWHDSELLSGYGGALSIL